MLAAPASTMCRYGFRELQSACAKVYHFERNGGGGTKSELYRRLPFSALGPARSWRHVARGEDQVRYSVLTREFQFVVA